MKLPRINIQHVLCATDLSEYAREAFEYAAGIANQFQAELTLLHVVREELPNLLVFDFGIERSASVKKRLEIHKEHLQEAKAALIEKAKAEYGLSEIDPNNVVVEVGNPVKTILQTAEDRGCDLIVMGIKGRSTLEDALMGDTVRRVLNLAKLPVLVVQRPVEN